MEADTDELRGLSGPRPRTFSNNSVQSQQSSKQNFPLMTSDSGLYTCSSNTSDCSLQLESDTDSLQQSSKSKALKDERLQLALRDVVKLRSELERLTKSEQWYKQELRQQKTSRLEDLERIYTQERKFMQESQRLQKECVRLYEKCNELERELEKQNDQNPQEEEKVENEDLMEENILLFEQEQQLSIIKDQKQLISVLRKQKRSLLEDLRSLTEEKDEKVLELQRLLADLEYDNKLITKKCTQFAKERVNLEGNLKETENRLLSSLEEKMSLQKSIVDLKEQLDIQKELIKLKENDINYIQQHYTKKIHEEQDLDEVHKLSIKYQEEINAKTLEIINLKERLQEMQDEVEKMQELQHQNDLQQRQIEELNFSMEAYRLELEKLKVSDLEKNQQLQSLHVVLEEVIKDKEEVFKTTVKQQNDLLRVKQTLKSTQEQYEQVQELYKRTQNQLELLQLEQGKLRFQNDRDQQEIEELRGKLKEYLQQTKNLSNKIQLLEQELGGSLIENSRLKEDREEMLNVIHDLEKNVRQTEDLMKLEEHQLTKEKDITIKSSFQSTDQNEIPDDPDFLELQQKCKKLQERLDFFNTRHLNYQNNQVIQNLNDFMKQIAKIEQENQSTKSSNDNQTPDYDLDFVNLSMQSSKLQQNLEKLNNFLQENHHLLAQINNIHDSNEGMEQLVIENEILKKKLCETEAEASTLQLKQDINERTQKYSLMKEQLQNSQEKVRNLQGNLLENDAKLYKLERKFKILDEADVIVKALQKDNNKLREQLKQEQDSKADLNKKIQVETEKLEELRICLERMKMNNRPSKNQATQCDFQKDFKESSSEVSDLKQNVLDLQQQQRVFLEQEASKKEERLQVLQKMLDLQNNKMQNLQQHQQDWEDMLISLNQAHKLEEKTRQELELKRLELEELNQVFAEQNEELRKLEEFTELLDRKRQQENENLKLTFQQEIHVMQRQLKECRLQIKQQKLENEKLEKRNEQYHHDINEDFASEVAEYKKEIRELKSKVRRIMEEKEEMQEQLGELQTESQLLKDSKREAFIMPEMNLIKVKEISAENSLENVELIRQTISEDHLRILTKVLEAEYQRKMQRYDEHIHSLLSNLKGLKKSLKANEEKTTLLCEEQLKTNEELRDLQKTKRSLEEMRLKYEQSQNVIKELKQALAFERKKFELSDIGKSSQNDGSNYEVSNLIDDYKKLIQQSALATKRPSTSALLDLIQRSNQCVPNLQKLESNVDGLRSELQNFLTSYNHKIPASSLIPAASLSVPPSLMDELRAASEGF